MEAYRNAEGKSGVKAYEVGHHSITLEFQDGDVYRYTYQSAGRDVVEKMIELARAGKGLNAYVSQRVRAAYAEKIVGGTVVETKAGKLEENEDKGDEGTEIK